MELLPIRWSPEVRDLSVLGVPVPSRDSFLSGIPGLFGRLALLRGLQSGLIPGWSSHRQGIASDLMVPSVRNLSVLDFQAVRELLPLEP